MPFQTAWVEGRFIIESTLFGCENIEYVFRPVERGSSWELVCWEGLEWKLIEQDLDDLGRLEPMLALMVIGYSRLWLVLLWVLPVILWHHSTSCCNHGVLYSYVETAW